MRLASLIGLLFLALESCEYYNTDVILKSNCESVSYKKEISPIIQSHCANSGCHVAGFQQGNFTCYDSLKMKIDNGAFKLRVFDTKSMPPLSKLNEIEFQKIKCWFDSGARNN